MMEEYDAIIIGSGQAGSPLALELAGKGKKVAFIEKSHFGGTCVNTGCTPTKALVATAKVAHTVRNSSEFGVLINDGFSVDMQKVVQRTQQLVQNAAKGLEDSLRNNTNIDVYLGEAKFLEDYVVDVNGKNLTAAKIFINVGARAVVPDVFRNIPFKTNVEILKINYLPKHLVVVGGSYLGLEFAQMFKRIGSEVTVLQRSKYIAPKEDRDFSELIQQVLEKEGIKIFTDTECYKAEKTKEGILLHLKTNTGKVSNILCTDVLLATGRMPNTDLLQLQNTSIQLDEKGYIKVGEKLETSVPGIFALGDCNGKGAFTHTSFNDYEIVVDHLFGEDKKRLSDRILTYAMYIDPPLAVAGLSEKKVRERGKPALVVNWPMSGVARAREKGNTFGKMRILIDKETEQILGATFFGISADEVIHSVLDVMYSKKSYRTIKEAVHIHPTVSELIPTMLGELEELE